MAKMTNKEAYERARKALVDAARKAGEEDEPLGCMASHEIVTTIEAALMKAFQQEAETDD